MGLTAGAVPARVDAGIKAGLLDLLDHAAEHGGWSTARACRLLGLDPDRAVDWRARRSLERLADLPPGGGAVHGLLEVERTAIVDLFTGWGEIDRSHRKLAARGSRLELVHVAPSTIRRVLDAEGYVLQGPSPREPAVRAPWPDWIVWKPNSIWCYDFTHFTRAKSAAIAVMDVVSRRWLTTLVSAQESSTQVEVAFTDALLTEGLAERIDDRLLAQLRAGTVQPTDLDGPDADGVPVLIVMSDNGPQMRSHSTRQFMAACAIMQRFGRPEPRPTKPGSRACSGTSRPSGRTWRRSATPASSLWSSTACASSTTAFGCTPGSATSPPTTSTTAAARASAKPAATDCSPHAKPDRLPSTRKQGPLMIARRSWLGISSARCRKESDTPHTSKVSAARPPSSGR